jgi:hypothetical protein
MTALGRRFGTELETWGSHLVLRSLALISLASASICVLHVWLRSAASICGYSGSASILRFDPSASILRLRSFTSKFGFRLRLRSWAFDVPLRTLFVFGFGLRASGFTLRALVYRFGREFGLAQRFLLAGVANACRSAVNASQMS